MKENGKWRFIWLLTMAATLGFIWQQSTLAPAASSAASGAVSSILVRLFGGADTALGAFFSRYIRKLAHFGEFFLLGLQSEAYLARRHTRTLTLLQSSFGVFSAASDEFIQLFTSRGASFLDVLLDTFGYLSAVLLLRFILYLFRQNKGKADMPAEGIEMSDV